MRHTKHINFTLKKDSCLKIKGYIFCFEKIKDTLKFHRILKYIKGMTSVSFCLIFKFTMAHFFLKFYCNDIELKDWSLMSRVHSKLTFKCFKDYSNHLVMTSTKRTP